MFVLGGLAFYAVATPHPPCRCPRSPCHEALWRSHSSSPGGARYDGMLGREGGKVSTKRRKKTEIVVLKTTLDVELY